MKMEHAQNCFAHKIYKYYDALNAFKIRQPEDSNDPDYIENVFGRDWFFCKCKQGMETECERGFSSKATKPCFDSLDDMCVIS